MLYSIAARTRELPNTRLSSLGTILPCSALFFPIFLLSQPMEFFHPDRLPLRFLFCVSRNVPGFAVLIDLGALPTILLSLVAVTILMVVAFYFGQTFARSHHAEEELERLRETFDERVRERSDEALKSSVVQRAGEERMARIIDSAMDAIITIDESQRITLFNPAAERMFGCPANDALGSPLERFLPSRFRNAHAAHIQSFSQNGVTRRSMGGLTPLRGLRTNGEEFPIEASISQVEVSGRKLFTAIVRDITETSRAREVSSRLAAIVQSSDDAIISKTLDGIVTTWNPGAERLFGCSAAEAIGRPMSSFFPPERQEEEQEILRRIAKGETIEHFESQRIRKDGQCIDVSVSISPLRDTSGQIIGATKIARDISERKRAEEEMRQQASLLNLAPVLVRDLQSRIVLWTSGAQAIYGYTEKEALGRVSHELMSTEFPRPVSEIEEILKDHGSWKGELTHKRRDGEPVVVASEWVLYRDAKGNPSRILEVNTDITALKRAEVMQLRSQKLQAMGTLTSGIAHDFNNILAAINGSALLAISQFPADHPVQACLVEIEKAGQRATDLVKQIMSFSRPQEQNMQVQDLQSIVQEALRLVRSTLPVMIEIRSDSEPELPPVRVDATQMHQVVVNLATNAAHAIGERNGLIEVKIEKVTISEDEIRLYSPIPAGEYLRLTIADNGSGMDKATVDRIFDPFFTTKPPGKGTGLGLSVVHGIVQAHHGFLRVYSQIGKGSSFQIYFPAAKALVVEESPSETETPLGNGEQILFVDDENVLVFVGAMMLEQKGYRVVSTASGDAALQEFRQRAGAFDAVISDLSMPGMSGLQLARELQAIRQDIPIILTSGYFGPDEQAAATKLGIRALLTKPVNPKELLGVIEQICKQSAELRRSQPGKA